MLGAVIESWARRIFFLDFDVFFFGTAIYFLLAVEQKFAPTRLSKYQSFL